VLCCRNTGISHHYIFHSFSERVTKFEGEMAVIIIIIIIIIIIVKIAAKGE
jgi:hypothetical protein